MQNFLLHIVRCLSDHDPDQEAHHHQLSYLGEAEVGVSQRQALMPGGVEVRLGPAVGNKRAVHLWSGHVQFVLLERDTKQQGRRRSQSAEDEEGEVIVLSLSFLVRMDVFTGFHLSHSATGDKYTLQWRGQRSTRSTETQFPTQGHRVHNEIVNCDD